MKNIVKSYEHISLDEDLNYCPLEGIVYQKDMSISVAYDENYFDNYVQRENTEIANKLNEVRVATSHKYATCILDVGIGSGEFMNKSKVKTYGFDINPVAVNWLKEAGLYVDPFLPLPSDINGWTFWDVIEHVPEPQVLFKHILPGHFVFVSIPIFDDVTAVRKSKHFKPNEHYYYFSRNGFVIFMEDSGFRFIEWNEDETHAGREGIMTFTFQKK